jgi:hypothetical protein
MQYLKNILEVTNEMGCFFLIRKHISVYAHNFFNIYLYIYLSSHKLHLISLKELCICKFWRQHLRIKTFNCSCV